MLKTIALALLLAACGDNIHPVDAPPFDPGKLPDHSTDNGGVEQDPDGTPCDAGSAGTPDASEEASPSCCVGALEGDVPIECGPPKGKCARFICSGLAVDVCRQAE